LEDQLGQSLSSLSEETPGIRTLIKMVWAGLIHEEPSLTINEVTELLDYSDIETVSETVSLAFENTFSKDTKKNMSKTKMKKQS